MVQRHPLPVLGKRLLNLMLLMDRTHSSVFHFFTYYPDILIIMHLRDLCSTWLLRFWALRPKVAFFATVETHSVSSTCFASINVHGIWVPLRGWNPCGWWRILIRPS